MAIPPYTTQFLTVTNLACIEIFRIWVWMCNICTLVAKLFSKMTIFRMFSSLERLPLGEPQFMWKIQSDWPRLAEGYSIILLKSMTRTISNDENMENWKMKLKKKRTITLMCTIVALINKFELQQWILNVCVCIWLILCNFSNDIY